MKNIVHIAILAVLLSACTAKQKDTGFEKAISSNDLVQLKAAKQVLELQSQDISSKLDQLSAKILVLEPNTKIQSVTTKVVKSEVFKHFIELQGNVQTKQNMLLYPQAPAKILRLLVKKGSRVFKGQVLAMLDDNGLKDQLEGLKIQSELAKTTYERQQNLWDQKIGSEIQFLQSKAQYEASMQGIKQLERNIDRYIIKAPFDGVIDDVFKESGAFVAPGRGGEVFRVVNLSKMYVEADVPEIQLVNVKKGKEVVVDYDLLNKQIVTKVKQVGDFINPLNRTFKLEVTTPNLKGLVKPNMTARLKVNDYTNKKAILISQSIVSEDGSGQKYVYVLVSSKGNRGVAKKRVVELGKSAAGVVEVLRGLKVDEKLIIEGAKTIKDGQEVVVL